MKKCFRMSLAAALLLVLLWLPGAMNPPAHAEEINASHNGQRDTACFLNLDGVVNDTLSREGDTSAWFRLELPGSGALKLTLEHEYIDSESRCCQIRLYPGDSANALWTNSVNGKQASVTFDDIYPGAGTWLVEVALEGPSKLDFSLTTAFTPVDYAEQEANNSPSTASPLPANVVTCGSLTSTDDVDYFRVDLEKPGMVQLYFSHEYFEADWNYYQVTIGQGVNVDALYSEKLTGMDSEWNSRVFYLDKGVYYIKVAYYSNYTGIPYAVSLTYTPLENAELEPNGAFTNATPVPLNVDCYGALTLQDDVDFYAFTLDQPGRLDIHCSHEYFDSDFRYYSFELMDLRSKAVWLGTEMTGQQSETQRTVFLQPGDYCLRAKIISNWTRVPYSFRLEFTPQTAIEQEWNDTYATATPIGFNQAFSGTLMDVKDEDYFVFPLDQSATIRIDFAFEYKDDTSNYYELSLDAAPGVSCWKQKFSGRDSSFASEELALEAGSYTLRIHAGSQWTSLPYALTIVNEAIEEPLEAIPESQDDAENGSPEADPESEDTALLDDEEEAVQENQVLPEVEEQEEVTLEEFGGPAEFALGEPDGQDKPASVGLEPNDTFDLATPVTLDSPINASLEGRADVDCYSLELSETTTIVIRFTETEWPEGEACDIEFYSATDKLNIGAELKAQAGMGERITKHFTLSAGRFYIRIVNRGKALLPYSLAVEHGDAITPIQAPSSASQSTPEPMLEVTPEPTIEPTQEPSPEPTPEVMIEPAPELAEKASGDSEKLIPGDLMIFGHFEQDDMMANGPEPIQWIVLDSRDGAYLLLSNSALDAAPGKRGYADSPWASSQLREWLNHDFVEMAFSSEELNHIQLTCTDTDGCDSDDTVFVLNSEEVEAYFSLADARIAAPTIYALSRGTWVAENGACRWWLRSPSTHEKYAAFVSENGEVFVNGNGFIFSGVAIRPAIWYRP